MLKLIIKLFGKQISKSVASYIRNRESKIEDRIFWKSNLEEGDCIKSLDCWDRTLDRIAKEVEEGRWFEP